MVSTEGNSLPRILDALSRTEPPPFGPAWMPGSPQVGGAPRCSRAAHPSRAIGRAAEPSAHFPWNPSQSSPRSTLPIFATKRLRAAMQ